MHMAAAAGKIDCVKLLLQNGADAHAVDSLGRYIPSLFSMCVCVCGFFF